MHFKNNPLFQISLGLLILGMASCVDMVTPIEEPVEDTPISATKTTPTATMIAENILAETVNNCLECHTDKERLIDNAKPILEVVSENEGAG